MPLMLDAGVGLSASVGAAVGWPPVLGSKFFCCLRCWRQEWYLVEQDVVAGYATLSGDQQVAGSGVCASQPAQYEHTVQYPATDLPDLRDSASDLTLQV